MPKHGKKHRAATATLEDGPLAPRAALERVKELSFVIFDETVDLAVRLGVDPRRADQVVRGTVVLPAGTGRRVRGARRFHQKGKALVPRRASPGEATSIPAHP